MHARAPRCVSGKLFEFSLSPPTDRRIAVARMSFSSKRTRTRPIVNITEPSIDIVIYDDSPAPPQDGPTKRRKAAHSRSIVDIPDPSIDIVFYDDSPTPSQNAPPKQRKAVPKPIHFCVEGSLPAELDPSSSVATGSQPRTSQQEEQESLDQAEDLESIFGTEGGGVADDILDEETDKNNPSRKVSHSELRTRIANSPLL